MSQKKKSSVEEAKKAIVNEPVNEQPELSKKGKIALLAVMLLRPEGATLNELAHALRWKENSVRGAISTIGSKKIGAKIISEKINNTRYYKLMSLDPVIFEDVNETIN